MAQKTLVICDQCKREESNEIPHAHSMSGLLPLGWAEIAIDHVPANTLEREEALRRLHGLNDEGDVIDAAFVELDAFRGHRHVFAKKKSASLCPDCVAKLSIRCGDADVMFADLSPPDNLVGSIVGPGFPLQRRR